MAKKEKPSESQGYGLLIAAVVSIVAIVGLVILFRGGASGRLVEMESNWNYNPGLGAAISRGDKMAFEPPNCPLNGEGTGIGGNDFNTGNQACANMQGFGYNAMYYRDMARGYREAEGGMAIESKSGYEGYTADSFNSGAYGKGVREGIDRTTLPAASKEGIVLG